ncbi:DUF58 domain-containing protein [Nocardioides dongxiaopingii]|uniref:DUF58 domain-containing protein n=1 Tax=Nocardioides sp. S-1144 TaxID=2582905 RepID=UPI00110D394F|nr:DUF58 domain-containing protein [Nocardioides sp. S-1144]QCW51694.1 DUF58 domain-containing protein [Nocardioides sp. S-1144]
MTVPTRVRAALGVVRPLGWLLLGLGVLALAVASQTRWRELVVLGTACLLLLALCLPFLLGRTRVRVAIVLEPSRVVAGSSVSGGVDVTNASGRRMLPTLLELPVGAAVHRYGVPALAAGATSQESFTIRTERRGVIEVGPAVTRRGDAVGVFSRDSVWAEAQEVLVRPPLVPLDAMGAGLLRDLEGVETDAISQSDLAFHALREYVAGDDLRHVHWRSSAKAMGAGQQQLLVRQYLDTRRSHATVVVDDDLASWADDDELEIAMSVAASVLVRAIADEFEATFVCGPTASSGVDGNLALDAVCRASAGSVGLVGAARRAVDLAPDTSLLFLLTGAAAGLDPVLRAAAVFPPEVRRLALLVERGVRPGVSEVGGLSVLRLGDKDDLPALLRWSV